MWESPEPRLAEFRANGWKLIVAAEPAGASSQPVDSIRLLACRDGLVGGSAQIRLPGIELAPLAEMFIRGDEVHLGFPVGPDHSIGLELVMLGIEADEDRLVIESMISINTSLLDSSPQVEFRVGAGHPGRPRWGEVPWQLLAKLSDVHWWSARPHQPGTGPGVTTHLACDRRDLSSLDPHEAGQGEGLRFFGDFLEKGVIRRIRPWWLWSNGTVTRDVAERISRTLDDRPLPLSS